MKFASNPNPFTPRVSIISESCCLEMWHHCSCDCVSDGIAHLVGEDENPSACIPDVAVLCGPFFCQLRGTSPTKYSAGSSGLCIRRTVLDWAKHKSWHSDLDREPLRANGWLGPDVTSFPFGCGFQLQCTGKRANFNPAK